MEDDHLWRPSSSSIGSAEDSAISVPVPIDLPDPITAELQGYQEQQEKLLALRANLTYIDRKVDFELRKAKKSGYLLHQLGQERYREHIQDLTRRRRPCLLREQDGKLTTLSGLAGRLATHFGDSVQRGYPLPKAGLVPWENKPDRKPRPYQELAMEKLLEGTKNGPAAVSIGTGLGKSFIALLLVKELGLRTVVMAPSKSIAGQLYEDFTKHLGQKRVGMFGDGKKDHSKHVVVAIDRSLANVEEGSSAWKNLVDREVFVADESHLTPARTLQDVCMRLMSRAPYRFFFSGTQMRNDGLDLVLEGIIGPIVFEMTVKEGVDQGYLARPYFTMVPVQSTSSFSSDDANEMTRQHMYYNPDLNARVGSLANKSVQLLKRPTLILVDEVEQFSKLLPHLRAEVGFAHGGLTKVNRGKVPEAFYRSDPTALVKAFDRGELPVLVGTSCISTGTDIKTVGTILRIKGGTSEIEVSQDVGRGTRRVPGVKENVNVIDFDVQNVPVLHRHAQRRSEIYDSIYGPVKIWGQA